MGLKYSIDFTVVSSKSQYFCSHKKGLAYREYQKNHILQQSSINSFSEYFNR